MANTNTLNHVFVILCGGTGPRLWPLSTTSHPKQLLPILSDKSLLEQTILRLLSITAKENIYITTSDRNVNQIKNIAKSLLPINNIFVEPDKKNTALAIYFTLSQLAKLDQNTVVSFLPSDHFISPNIKFKIDLNKAGQIAIQNSSIVTIGIHPSFPNPSYGYLLKSNKFIEKPDKIHALKYIVNGALWNSGIYTSTIKTYLSEFDKHFKNPSYSKSKPLSFDKAISEKTKNIEHIKATFDWSDVGEWGSIFNKSKQDKNHIATINSKTKYLVQSSRNCLVSSDNQDKLIGLVGVNNLAIIDTPNALLVTSLEHSSQVRDLVTQIATNPKLKHFFVDDEK